MLKDQNFNYGEAAKRYPDTLSDDLRKLELLIIENFYDLKLDLFKLKKVLLDHSKYLFSIITNKLNSKATISLSQLEQASEQFENSVIEASYDLRQKLIKQYINKPNPSFNIYIFLKDLRTFIKKMFEKPMF